MADLNIFAGVCLGVCWGSSTLSACYKCNKYSCSEQGKLDSARTTSTTVYSKDRITGKEVKNVYVNNPRVNKGCQTLLCWSLGGPISNFLFARELYYKRKEKKQEQMQQAVTTQPVSTRDENNTF